MWQRVIARPRTSRAGLALRWVATLMGAAILARVLWTADLPRAWALIRSIGPLIALAVSLPYLMLIASDALGWRWIFLMVGRRLPFTRLFRVRLSTEAVLLSFPGGLLLAESLKPVMLARDGVPMGETVATIAAKKVLQLSAQSIYLGAAAVLGWGVLATISNQMIGRRGLELLVLATAMVLGLVAAALMALFLRASLARRAHDFVARIRSVRLRRWLEERRASFSLADEHVGAVFGAHPGRVAVGTIPFFFAWLAESIESWAILSLLGAGLSFSQVMAFEAVLSLLRSLVFFVPAGIGVQDAGYMTALGAMAVPDARNLAAAFVLIKRVKEVCWIVVGYALLIASNRGQREA